MAKKGLGKGLGSLLGEEAVKSVETPAVQEVAPLESGGVHSLKLGDVEPNPNQPRKIFEETALGELADSIRTHGVLQPISVRRGENGRYIIVAGERRWRAARICGISNIPAIILDVNEGAAAELALIENLQREDLNPVEEAEGFKTLMENYSLTQAEISERVGKSRSAVANSLRLLSLDSEVLDLLSAGEITPGHARALVPLSPAEQVTLAERAADEGLSVRQIELLAAKIQAEPQEPQPEKEQLPKVVVNYKDVLSSELGEKLGRRVKITGGKRKGRVELEYYGVDDLNRLCDLLATLDAQEG